MGRSVKYYQNNRIIRTQPYSRILWKSVASGPEENRNFKMEPARTVIYHFSSILPDDDPASYYWITSKRLSQLQYAKIFYDLWSPNGKDMVINESGATITHNVDISGYVIDDSGENPIMEYDRGHGRINLTDVRREYKACEYLPSFEIDWYLAHMKWGFFERIPSVITAKCIYPYTEDLISAKTLFDPYYDGPLKTARDVCCAYIDLQIEKKSLMLLTDFSI